MKPAFSDFPWLGQLHPSHAISLHKVLIAVGLLALATAAAWALPPLPGTRGMANYLPLHILLETVSVVIAMQIFAVGWHVYQKELPGNILLLSCVFLGVGILDFSHLLSYAGMPDFVTPSSPEKAINFWLAARTLAAVSLLVVALTPWRPLASAALRHALLAAVLLLTASLHWLFLYHPEVLPHTFIAGSGLTPFKIGYEYGLIAINAVSALVLWQRMRTPQPFNAAAVFGAVCAMGLSELFFTLYADVTDIYNLMGHLYKSVSYVFLYRAVFIEAIDHPYNQLHESQSQLQATLDAVPDLLFELDLDGRCLDCHSSRPELLAAFPDQLVGQTAAEAMPAAAADTVLAALYEANQNGHSNSRQIELAAPDGKHWFELSVARKRAEQKQAPRFVVLARDITERVKNQAYIEKLSRFDQLTDLPNRTELGERFKYALSLAQRGNEPLAVMYLDLDRFKDINDTLGHSLGDQLLVKVAQRLKAALREEDALSRVGGDEFILLLPSASEDSAAAIAAALIEQVTEPYYLGHHELNTTLSIGIAIYPHDGTVFETLIKNADTAMHRVKQDGRNGFRFFTAEMQAHSARNLQLSSALNHALSQDQLFLQYQPQVSLGDGHIVGVEALLRWRHPELGLIPPAEFVPIAENSGHIVQIGEWVLRSAARQLKLWLDHGLPPIVVAVNLSAVQFRQPNLLETVVGILDEVGLPHHYLELELTEAVAMHDPQAVGAVMAQLHGHGIRMSIDDFGTGYSSLSYLKRFQAHKLKIDQSFVRDITDDPEDKAIVTAIIHMASSLGLKTIAEGVETADQLAFLQLQGCSEAQGYYFSKPLDAGLIVPFVKSNGIAPFVLDHAPAGHPA